MSRGGEPELSIRALAVGLLLGALLAAAGSYVGQLAGGGDSGHIPAAIVGFAILSALGRGRGPSPRETNIVQTAASSAAMMSLTGGFIGPIAALVLSGREPSLLATAAWGASLGIAGCAIAVPMRAAFVARDGLAFPSAVATAAVIETLHAGAAAAAARLRWLAIGAAIALAVVAAQRLAWIPDWSALPLAIGSVPAAAAGIGIRWSPLLAATGLIAGARVGVGLLLGSIAAWIALAPILVGEGLVAGAGYGPLVSWLVWPGVGVMIGGTLAGLASGWSTLGAGLRELRGAAEATDREPRAIRAHLLGGLAAAIAVAAFGRLAFGVHPAVSALALALAVPLCAAAIRAKGEADRTPAGPLGALGQLATGIAAPGGIAAPLCGGGIVNGTAMQSSMMVNNWRIGRALGGRPGAQLAASIAGLLVGAIAAAAAFELIRRAYGLGTAAMPAIAGQSWKATAEIVQHGASAMPPYAPLAAALGLALGLLWALAMRRPRLAWLPSPVAFGMAFITPASISLAIAAGALLLHPAARRRPHDATLLAAGAIAGEAIAGLAIAGWIVATG